MPNTNSNTAIAFSNGKLPFHSIQPKTTKIMPNIAAEVCARAAAENKTAIEINFRQILEAYKRSRSNMLTHMKRNIMLCKKFNADVITTSASLSKWNMRSARELAAIAYLLGLDLGNAIDTTTIIPEELVRTNREKLAGKRIEGVVIE